MSRHTGVCSKVADGMKKGVRFFDAPVSGWCQRSCRRNADDHRRGNAALLERSDPFSNRWRKKYFSWADRGWKSVKSINQIIGVGNTLSLLKAFVTPGIRNQPEKMFEVIFRVPVFCRPYCKFTRWLLKISPGFTLALMKKDLNIALSQAGKFLYRLSPSPGKIYLMLGEECETRITSVTKPFVKCMEEELPAKSAAE